MWFAVTQEAWCQIFVSLCAVGIENLFILWQIIVFNFLFLLSLNSYTVSEIPFHVLSVRQAPGLTYEVSSQPFSWPYGRPVTHCAPCSARSHSQQEAAVDSRKVMSKEKQELVFLWQQRFLREKTWSWPIIVQAAKDELPLNARFWATCSEVDQSVNQGTMISGLPMLERCGVPTMTQKLMWRFEASLWYDMIFSENQFWAMSTLTWIWSYVALWLCDLGPFECHPFI